jgi:hypothetical protein
MQYAPGAVKRIRFALARQAESVVVDRKADLPFAFDLPDKGMP